MVSKQDKHLRQQALLRAEKYKEEQAKKVAESNAARMAQGIQAWWLRWDAANSIQRQTQLCQSRTTPRSTQVQGANCVFTVYTSWITSHRRTADLKI
jgi:hypothetical protein